MKIFNLESKSGIVWLSLILGVILMSGAFLITKQTYNLDGYVSTSGGYPFGSFFSLSNPLFSILFSLPAFIFWALVSFLFLQLLRFRTTLKPPHYFQILSISFLFGLVVNILIFLLTYNAGYSSAPLVGHVAGQAGWPSVFKAYGLVSNLPKTYNELISKILASKEFWDNFLFYFGLIFLFFGIFRGHQVKKSLNIASSQQTVATTTPISIPLPLNQKKWYQHKGLWTILALALILFFIFLYWKHSDNAPGQYAVNKIFIENKDYSIIQKDVVTNIANFVGGHAGKCFGQNDYSGCTIYLPSTNPSQLNSIIHKIQSNSQFKNILVTRHDYYPINYAINKVLISPLQEHGSVTTVIANEVASYVHGQVVNCVEDIYCEIIVPSTNPEQLDAIMDQIDLNPAFKDIIVSKNVKVAPF